MQTGIVKLAGALLVTPLAGCGGGSADGSCTQQELESNLNFCTEKEEADSTFQLVCSALGGSWSSAPCDATRYARQCRQEVTESVNGGPEQVVHYVYYYADGSAMTCLGEETPL